MRLCLYFYELGMCRYVRLNALNVLHVHGAHFNAPRNKPSQSLTLQPNSSNRASKSQQQNLSGMQHKKQDRFTTCSKTCGTEYLTQGVGSGLQRTVGAKAMQTDRETEKQDRWVEVGGGEGQLKGIFAMGPYIISALQKMGHFGILILVLGTMQVLNRQNLEMKNTGGGYRGRGDKWNCHSM